MKNFFTLLILCTVQIVYAQNYLNDGGFEAGNSLVNFSGNCSSANVDLHGCEPNPLRVSYYNNCPGGWGVVSKKMLKWTDRNSGIDGCSCTPHSPDWLYNGYFNIAVAFSEETWMCPVGNGCMGSSGYEMFQQEMKTTIERKIRYRLSTKIRVNKTSWATNQFGINFILSGGGLKYKKESCEASNSNELGYTQLNTANSPVNYFTNYSLSNISSFTSWQTIEVPVDISGVTQSLAGGYHWFGVNVDCYGASINTGNVPYLGFDEMYIDEEGCFCPYDRNVNGITITGVERLRAQHNLTVSNTTIATPSDITVNITAGNAVELLDGFSTSSNSTVDIHIADCYDNDEPMQDAQIPTAFEPDCDGFADEWCFYTKGATSYKVVWCNRYGQCREFEGNIDLSNVSSEGGSRTCVPVPTIPGTWAYTYSLDLYACNGKHKSFKGNVTAFDATPRCSPSWKQNPDETSIDIISENSNNIHCSFYPNPTCDKATLEITNCQDDLIEVSIIDAKGSTLKKINIHSAKTEIPIGELTDGSYIAFVKSKSINQPIKFKKLCVY